MLEFNTDRGGIIMRNKNIRKNLLLLEKQLLEECNKRENREEALKGYRRKLNVALNEEKKVLQLKLNR
jgi:hypothetical protein